ncbi:hypothetical protein PRZ48_012160 [Zasmidium cellare]|uniref:3-carboxymuconate cyclase n=1 Tax=Zasmidium cellare TaxID=395010 RepID=A0ABR0E4J1_ZASCE|nr:hypothetical protein PRZ48_012160 [Zasmidium cellare]
MYKNIPKSPSAVKAVSSGFIQSFSTLAKAIDSAKFSRLANMLSKSLLLAGYGLSSLAFPFPFPHAKRALYISDNDGTDNHVIAASLSTETGLLSDSVMYSTGGKGLYGTMSQDAVVVEDEYLFVTNAGDNTLSVFKIDPLNPTHLRLLGKPAATNGHTPQTVAYSSAHNMACVANAGDKAGVQCYNVDPFRGLTALPFYLDIPQTQNFDPTQGPPGTLSIVGDIRFNPSATHLYAVVRSNGGRPGLLYAWPVSRFGQHISQTPTNSTLPELPFAFSLNFLGSDSKLFITTPHGDSPGSAIIDLSSSGAVQKTTTVNIAGQEAACWASYDPSRNRVFVIDSSIPTITLVDANTEKATQQFNFSTPALGGLDNRIDRDMFYLLTDPFDPIAGKIIAPPQVLVYNISGSQTPKQVQSYDILKVEGGNGTWPGEMGLAIYPAPKYT